MVIWRFFTVMEPCEMLFKFFDLVGHALKRFFKGSECECFWPVSVLFPVHMTHKILPISFSVECCHKMCSLTFIDWVNMMELFSLYVQFCTTYFCFRHNELHSLFQSNKFGQTAVTNSCAEYVVKFLLALLILYNFIISIKQQLNSNKQTNKLKQNNN